ncbi:hypothetical protein NEUTE1DRAFT_100237 [Neurospora tetrasperma FGSC 2508]|uniref:Uncharacterized protein n=1 Tax=Neurospora tetrasperma (strain FGSC 2508 / ATCC MYA-4615 / P0657) TaxID=510951 RepID=F8MJP5_NEUT8|nr:uncharacterized protein NEUTE1DRAFT_100237 [Neurospora tetrasperma FGSC 2508]EGO57286.1 hypothetical protein NEUTE1DRAFT_100237 [Neurospora tetrasperma FGSC 2508]EGZ72462.1 hypothetical protein NEUTE2DRAFT_66955 [Neurospora tetrasperma FGSC 2509]
MAGRSNPPRTPSPKSGRTGKITDIFKSVHQSEPKQPTKRELEVEDQDAQPTKKLKRSDDGHAGSMKTARYQVAINTPEPKTMCRKPASARLLDDTDGGLHESLVGRRDFLKETSTEDDETVEVQHRKSFRPIHNPAGVNNPRHKRPASSRLLDDTDGGLMDSLVGRSKTPRHGEEVPRSGEMKRNNGSMHEAMDDNVLDDDTEAETINLNDSENEMSSDQDGEDDYSEVDDSDKENVDPRNRNRTPSLPPPPAAHAHHGSQNETGDATPISQSSTSPSSLLLPSPVMDLPAPSPSSLPSVPPSTMPSPPSTP